jgi:REP element-mobilizing transposase RayT
MGKRKVRFEENCYYHIYNRGVEKRMLFLDVHDYYYFLRLNMKYCKGLHFSMITFTLMPNHYHFILRQDCGRVPVSKYMHKVALCYSGYFNRKYHRVGPLLQGRYQCKLITSLTYLIILSRYIHQNPYKLCKYAGVKNGIITGDTMKYLIKYPWSSLRYYVTKKQKGCWVDTKPILQLFTKEEYAVYVATKLRTGEERALSVPE